MTTADRTGTSKMHNSFNKWLRYGAVWCVVFIAVLSAASAVKAVTFVVTTTVDNGDNVNPTAGSLRQAIISANATTVADMIYFGPSATGTISPPISLPTITQPLIISGYGSNGVTSNGSTPATATTPAVLFVEISGANAGDSGVGLQFSAPACTTANCGVLGLVINRFGDSGIRINSGSVGIFGNFIGTNMSGTSNLCGTPAVLCGNIDRGILIVGSTGNAIGNTSVANRNIISANLGTGISITNGGSATVVQNFIGTDKNGTADLGNSQEGIRIVDSSNSVIGGGTAASRNVISGNDGSGISIIQSGNRDATGMIIPAANNLIAANFIGVDVTGNATTIIGGFQTSPVGNTGSGVLINAGGNTVGGNRTTGAAASTCVNGCNVIAGNRANGVSLGSNFATGNTVSGNNIGVGITGTPAAGTAGNAIGNRDNGIQISNLAAGNTIGGTGTTVGFCNFGCNVIANNGDNLATSARAGIYIDPTALASNSIRGNSIFANTGLGIDLQVIGTTANDSLDPDAGGNNQQNFPVVTTANDNEFIQGTLNSTAGTGFIIDFFVNPAADAVNLEGRTFIGSVMATTDASGNANFTFTSTVQLTVGQIVTATATSSTGSAQAVGDTSEFSAARPVTAAGTTAATTTVSGRLRTALGSGISGASVELFDARTGATFSVATDAEGVYTFQDVPVGSDYIITPLALGYSFNPTNKFISLLDQLSAVDFVGVKGRKGKYKN